MYTVFNGVQLIGRLGSTPKITTIENGKRFARFTIVMNQTYTNTIGETIRDRTSFNLLAWDYLADAATKQLRKGSRVSLEGRLVNRLYRNRYGTTKYHTEIEINEIHLSRWQTQ